MAMLTESWWKVPTVSESHKDTKKRKHICPSWACRERAGQSSAYCVLCDRKFKTEAADKEKKKRGGSDVLKEEVQQASVSFSILPEGLFVFGINLRHINVRSVSVSLSRSSSSSSPCSFGCVTIRTEQEQLWKMWKQISYYLCTQHFCSHTEPGCHS